MINNILLKFYQNLLVPTKIPRKNPFKMCHVVQFICYRILQSTGEALVLALEFFLSGLFSFMKLVFEEPSLKFRIQIMLVLCIPTYSMNRKFFFWTIFFLPFLTKSCKVQVRFVLLRSLNQSNLCHVRCSLLPPMLFSTQIEFDSELLTGKSEKM